MLLPTKQKFTDLPKEIILTVLEFAVDKIDFISVLFNINKEIRELVKENPIWIHISHILDVEKSITPIQSIIKSNFYSPDGQIFSKLQEYFQSLTYIQYIQLQKQDDGNRETIIFDPFSKLALCDSSTFSELIQIFGINAFRTFHSSINGPNTNIGIMDTMMYDLDVNRGETIIQASFMVGEDKSINAFLIQFNDKRNEVKEPPMLTCPELNVTITASDVSNNFPFSLLENMKLIISSKYGSPSEFICWEKVRVKKSKIFKISRKEETTHCKIKQIMKQKRFEYWFGSENTIGSNSDCFFKFVKVPTQQV
ncbi:predicted protein [Naegleria gruberi]|uniref:Predicted protein n=1 Tax=Naegleria gruberi TaxID=5762 RepID=D2UXK0_NAEGR|nr:uncharacterized protein NAEGRDRAFT_61152 [Naegleria gruberi]EFC50646.1 predicted protein [Naegleria gruberi]|eukprot:XP_002683390.1 predicted protein [Naegleria gruberi strain NEG-M]